jgi:beta-glucanase (GH16 family)
LPADREDKRRFEDVFIHVISEICGKNITNLKFNFTNMKNLLRLLFVCSLIIVFSFSLKHSSQKWNSVWSDEFNYTGLPDSSKWNYDVGGDGWGNHELEYYTKARLENARVENGNLIIEAHKEKFEGGNYTSARLVTKGKADWKYGRIEVRAKLPKGLSTWPAIWMLGSTTPLKWPDDGEIDIMEHVGYDPGAVHASVHCKKYNHVIHTQKTAITQVPDFADAFHVYAVEWDEAHISIFVDDKKYFTFTNEHSSYDAWPFDQKMHLLLNLAIGGDWGGQKGVDNSIFPVKMLVDYVRVYEVS